MKKPKHATNFDRDLTEQLRLPLFAARFKRAGEAWDSALTRHKMKTQNKPTKDELRFVASLQEGLKYAHGLKAKGVIVERHPLRATKDAVKALILSRPPSIRRRHRIDGRPKP
jgi:hypothetical protein